VAGAVARVAVPRRVATGPYSGPMLALTLDQARTIAALGQVDTTCSFLGRDVSISTVRDR
jgi:hypothetical protein